MSDSPYVTGTALIAVTDSLLARLNGQGHVTQESSFGPTEPALTFGLTQGLATDSNSSARSFSRFIRHNCELIAVRLDDARTASRADGQSRVVDLAGLATDSSWPVLTITVG